MTEKATESIHEPTRFPELNQVLVRLVEGVHDCLGDNLAGVYLQGSFALGDADEYSDVDFLAVTNSDVTEDQERALRAMHASLHEIEIPWAQHLEGSYASKDRFRRVDPQRTPLLFLDNGASELELDSHCNSAVTRWIVRERGIALFGPEAKRLIDAVPAADLRREATEALQEFFDWAPEPTKAGPMSRWKQPYLVLTFCRILNTLENGKVASKTEAAEWAKRNLDARWRPPIEKAVEDRPDPWKRVHERADDAAIRETLAFADYALERREQPVGSEHLLRRAVDEIRASRPPEGMDTHIVAVDGPGGAGKTSLSEWLASELDASIVHTDDFASWDNPTGWWPDLIEKVLKPVAAGSPARYRPTTWGGPERSEVTVKPGNFLILEGVTASREAFRPYLAYSIWIETPREVRMGRGIKRDGEHMREQWEEWMAGENRYIAREHPAKRADLVLPGGENLWP